MPERAPVVVMEGVGVRRGGTNILTHVDWRVLRGENWLVIGPNGSGKTTLLALAAARLQPTAGSVTVLGGRLGKIDLRSLRSRIGMASPALARQLRSDMTAEEVVLSGRRGALETWWHQYGAEDRSRARAELDAVGVTGRSDHRIGTLSSGEMRRLLIARALACDPELLLLDEPASALDLAARESLMAMLSVMLQRGNPPMILVTHHLEEIPPGISHALLLKDGAVLAQGTVQEVLVSATVSSCFDVDVTVRHSGGRWSATAR